MNINSNKKAVASLSSNEDLTAPPKISIYYKPTLMRVISTLVVYACVLVTPTPAHAGFFSFLGDLFGTPTLAANEIQEDSIHNSQTLPLMEPDITPDLKNSQYVAGVMIVDGEALETFTGPEGTDADLQKYSSSESRINIYTVKAGDTLESIAKTNKVSRAAILYANSDLSMSEITKEGQTLVIIPFKGALYTVKKGDTLSGISTKYKVSVSDILEYNNLSSAGSIVAGKVIILPGLDDSTLTKTTTTSTKTSGTTTKLKSGTPDLTSQGTGGYIWPFPAGVGRVSQGMHDGQAYDFAAPMGTPIYAIQSGRVLISKTTGYNGGYGLYTVVDFDNGAQAIFAHMTKVVAVPGTRVEKGALLGYVGSTGRSTGPHTHIEFRGGSKNPYKNLKKNATSANWKSE